MMADVDCIVLGAGVIGLAITRALAQAGQEVLLIEKADAPGTETSSRNSEVIHAGIYYTPGSLKARCCVRGKALLYRYCEARGIPYRRIGKLIVAQNAQEEAGLMRLAQQAQANGVDDLRLLDARAAQALEPGLRCHSALLSPSTGIIDSHALMLALQGDAQHAGAQTVFNTCFTHGQRQPDGLFSLDFQDSLTGEASSLTARVVVNASGLHAPDVARRMAGTPHDALPQAHYCRGAYFTLKGASPFRHLIYPMPTEISLGVHLTLDMGGQTRFGPDIEWLDSIDYDLDENRAQGFYTAVREYWPALPDNALQPGYTGIRPKITGPGQPAADFLILGPRHHGIGGLVHLLGMESPGLTSCLALAEYVHELLSDANP